MSTKGGLLFTFSLPGGRFASLPPRQLRHRATEITISHHRQN